MQKAAEIQVTRGKNTYTCLLRLFKGRHQGSPPVTPPTGRPPARKVHLQAGGPSVTVRSTRGPTARHRLCASRAKLLPRLCAERKATRPPTDSTAESRPALAPIPRVMTLTSKGDIPFFLIKMSTVVSTHKTYHLNSILYMRSSGRGHFGATISSPGTISSPKPEHHQVTLAPIRPQLSSLASHCGYRVNGLYHLS